jgi:death-on-curing protein
VWLLPSVVAAIHDAVILEHGGVSGLRDQGLLESALARPKHLFHYAASSTLYELAASYAFGIAKNHPFIDGNKRGALTLAATFLQLNGAELDANEAETVVVFEQLAAGTLSETELAHWLRANAKEA